MSHCQPRTDGQVEDRVSVHSNTKTEFGKLLNSILGRAMLLGLSYAFLTYYDNSLVSSPFRKICLMLLRKLTLQYFGMHKFVDPITLCTTFIISNVLGFGSTTR